MTKTKIRFRFTRALYEIFYNNVYTYCHWRIRDRVVEHKPILSVCPLSLHTRVYFIHSINNNNNFDKTFLRFVVDIKCGHSIGEENGKLVVFVQWRKFKEIPIYYVTVRSTQVVGRIRKNSIKKKGEGCCRKGKFDICIYVPLYRTIYIFVKKVRAHNKFPRVPMKRPEGRIKYVNKRMKKKKKMYGLMG